jgi:hypothetical protein
VAVAVKAADFTAVVEVDSMEVAAAEVSTEVEAAAVSMEADLAVAVSVGEAVSTAMADFEVEALIMAGVVSAVTPVFVAVQLIVARMPGLT